jgi:hypothetical protein
MTGVLPFLLFSLSSQSFTHMDAHSSQSFTSTSQGRPKYIEGKDFTWVYDYKGDLVKYWHASHRIDKDTPIYPEPEGDPSY